MTTYKIILKVQYSDMFDYKQSDSRVYEFESDEKALEYFNKVSLDAYAKYGTRAETNLQKITVEQLAALSGKEISLKEQEKRIKRAELEEYELFKKLKEKYQTYQPTL